MFEKIYYVYILTNARHMVLYIGVTNDLSRRIGEHRQKIVDGFTKKYNTTKLVYYEKFNDVYQAISREKQLKRWRREKKEWLINRVNPKWVDLISEWEEY